MKITNFTKIMKIMKISFTLKLFQMVSRRFLHTPPVSPCSETSRLIRKHLKNPIEIVYTSHGNPTLPSQNSKNHAKKHENHIFDDYEPVDSRGVSQMVSYGPKMISTCFLNVFTRKFRCPGPTDKLFCIFRSGGKPKTLAKYAKML